MTTRLMAGLTVFMLVAGASAETADRITIPAGTAMRVRLESNVGSDISSPRDHVRGRLAQPLVIDGRTAIPVGSEVSGTVVEAQEAGRVGVAALQDVRPADLVVHAGLPAGPPARPIQITGDPVMVERFVVAPPLVGQEGGA